MNIFTAVLFAVTAGAFVGYVYDFLFRRKRRKIRMKAFYDSLAVRDKVAPGERIRLTAEDRREREKLDSEGFILDQCRSLFVVLQKRRAMFLLRTAHHVSLRGAGPPDLRRGNPFP